jgi:putative ABC transport system substrate-binding protein
VRRRDVITSIVVASVLWPALSRAQSAKPAPRIGVLAQFSAASRFSVEFREAMRELGYVDGQNLAIEFASAVGSADRLPGLAAELVKLRVDVIVASGSEATRAARKATTAIPIVMTSSNPLGLGFVASLARPGGNVTGLSLLAPEVSGKRIEILKQILPGITRVAVLLYPDDPGVAFSLKETEAAAESTALKLQILKVQDAAAFDNAFQVATRERVEAIIVLPAPLMNVQARQIAELALKNRLPTIYFSDDLPKAGGLVSYGVSLPAIYRRLAYYVDRILKGAKPGDLPIEQPTKFELVINLKTARALGITVPQSLLLRADEVIQ